MENQTKLTALATAIRRLCRRIFLIAGAGSMVVMVLLILCDVGMRNLFNRPLMSTYELVMFLMVVVVFPALSYTQSEGNIVKIELVVSRFPKKAQAFLEMGVSFLSLGLVLLIAWRNAVRAVELRHEHLVSPILHVPVYPFYLAVTLGMILVSLVLFVEVLESLSRWLTGE
ncbi:MAG: TRAP transporter small permease [Syntrophaceae bacterium]|nr:TRAP transporter small permease [Syntrophaceae bacterium]